MVNKITTPPTTSELIGTVNEIIDDKQDTLVSGTNIKTINNTSILGSGNIDIQGGGSYTAGTGIDITNDVISIDNSIVTTNTVQTITSQKTFNSKISVKDISNLTGTTILETYAGNTNVGTSNTSLLLKSNLTRPYFNNTSTQLALLSDVPTDTSDLTNGAGYITGITSGDVTTALGYTPYNSSNPNGYITNSALTPYVLSADLASVATSGSYNDLSNKPTIPSAQVNSDWNAVSGVAEILNKPTLGTMAGESASDYTPTANLATVATSGSYDDLLNKPTIPTVNDATLTITQGGVSKGTFTANASSNVTIDLDSGGGSTTYDSTNERIIWG